MASPFWEEKAVKVDGRDVLVERVRWKGTGRWKLEAWVHAPLGGGVYLRNGKWLDRAPEAVARQAIADAFPEAQGEWDGGVLREAKADPEG